MERNYGTWQGRLPQELRLADVTTVEAANRFLRDHYIQEFNARFTVPAVVAGTVLATARGLGEAVMLAMVAGGSAFAANPLDGLTFLFEPVRPLAAEILQESGGLTIGVLSHTLYAIAAVLLVSATLLSFAGWAAKQPLKRYGIRA